MTQPSREPAPARGRPGPMSTDRGPWSFIASSSWPRRVFLRRRHARRRSSPGTGLAITAVAGPICPVEKIPPRSGLRAAARGRRHGHRPGRSGHDRRDVVTRRRGHGRGRRAAGPASTSSQPQPVTGLMGTAASRRRDGRGRNADAGRPRLRHRDPLARPFVPIRGAGRHTSGRLQGGVQGAAAYPPAMSRVDRRRTRAARPPGAGRA